jgi:hypothetical protein
VTSRVDELFIRVACRARDDETLNQISGDAFRLWIFALAYSRERETDGLIRAHEWSRFAPQNARTTTKRVHELVHAGLLVEHTDGHTIRNYDRFQETKAEIDERRQSLSQRGKRGAEKRWHQQTLDSHGHSSGHSSGNGRVIAETEIEIEKEKEPPPAARARAREARTVESAAEAIAGAGGEVIDLDAHQPDELARVTELVGPLSATQRSAVLVRHRLNPAAVEACAASVANDRTVRSRPAVFLERLKLGAHLTSRAQPDYLAAINEQQQRRTRPSRPPDPLPGA